MKPTIKLFAAAVLAIAPAVAHADSHVRVTTRLARLEPRPKAKPRPIHVITPRVLASGSPACGNVGYKSYMPCTK